VIRPVDGAPDRLEFAHALLHEAAYARLLRRTRQALHAQVAELLTGRFAELVEREPELAALHFSRAVLPARAVPLWEAAGELALRRAAFLEAADHTPRLGGR
jgi:predicted ATPase